VRGPPAGASSGAQAARLPVYHYRMPEHRIYTTSVASVYPHYITKAEKKGRTKAEVDEIFRWLTGYSQKRSDAAIAPTRVTNSGAPP
jgi:hypothetical protein